MTINVQLESSKDEKKALEFWEGLSSFYVNTTNLFNLSTRVTVDGFMSAVDVKPGQKILDAGCGHLRISLGMLRKEPDLSITGADFTQALLDQGKALCSQMNIDNIELHCCNIKELPFEDSCFDNVVSARVFQYLDDPVMALKQLLRVVKSGGKVVVSVPNRHNPIKLLKYNGKLFSASELREHFAEAGFVNVESSSLCFVPGKFGWDSKLKVIEGLSKVPLLSGMGGNIMVVGQKPV